MLVDAPIINAMVTPLNIYEMTLDVPTESEQTPDRWGTYLMAQK